MNLHAIVSGAIGAINPHFLGDVAVSTGVASVTGSGRQIPGYTVAQGVTLQVQALAAKDLAHLSNLNIEGVTRKVWLNGNIEGVVRPAGKGGDLLRFDGRVWLVTVVFETWDADGWCSVGITQQKTDTWPP